ncbi:TonB-dependent receptor [Belliella buryatensis]|uniref:TonB-dependent receptor n=1 Tax=Belliella buryatensis TaxID=1500549 RepID=A0A239CQG7_9BACT|nr:TonB-dependent receptor [Belliella buryatensis]SNS22496.1 TonB-dependent receptor [Belliella buryatensis]
MKIKLLLLSFLLIGSSDSFAAKIIGKIRDTSSKELLIGAYVSITNNSSQEVYRTITGLDGTYNLSNIPKGVYSLEVSFMGYASFREIIEFTTDNTTLSIDFDLESDDAVLSEVIVSAGVKGTDIQARQLEKNSASVLNIISARQIQLSPDITVANVIQRVSGLSIERNASGDPQYAIVRGMDKRYNNTLVNGIKIPSPDNENRFVPLDIFPAVLLERLEVYKSLTANMEADAIGGTVNMIMKSAPNQLMLEGDIQLGYNQLNLDRPFQTYDRSYLNRRSPKERFGDNYRATPADFPVENMINKGITTLPDIFANLTFGNRYLDNKLGVMLGGSFQNSYRPVSNYFYDPGVSFLPGNPLLMRELIERETSSQLQRTAFHGKLDYAINPKHSISLYLGQYLLNEFRVRDQVRRESFVSTTDYAVYPITRFSNIFQSITTTNLQGDKVLIKNRQEIFFWERQLGETMVEMLARTPVRAPYIGEPQGEAICLDPNNNYYTVSEELNSSTPPNLYKYLLSN